MPLSEGGGGGSKYAPSAAILDDFAIVDDVRSDSRDPHAYLAVKKQVRENVRTNDPYIKMRRSQRRSGDFSGISGSIESLSSSQLLHFLSLLSHVLFL